MCLETDAREPAEFAHQKPQNATESSGSEGLERAAVFTGHSALPGVCSVLPNQTPASFLTDAGEPILKLTWEAKQF